MQLMHYAQERVTFNPLRTYGQPDLREFQKPNGLWVSVRGEDDWPSWCARNDYGNLQACHEVELRPSASILYLLTPDDILDFHERYAVQLNGSARHYAPPRMWPLDWRSVADKWDGVIIAPYQWSLRMEGPSWYYGWDCASGCIWNADAIGHFEVAV